jgi:hypothetical protein
MADHKQTHPRAVFGCDECIALGNRGTPDGGEMPAGWAYYRVDVTRTLSSYYYVRAANKEAATADAKEITLHREDFAEDDTDTYVFGPVTPEHGDLIWTGGPDGDWTSMKRDAKEASNG